jgi:hypothetical protein
VCEKSNVLHTPFTSWWHTKSAERKLEVYIAEQQRKTPECPAAERYYAEYVSLHTAASSAEVAL